MKYGNQAITRIDDETKFKLKKIKQYKNRSLREIVELGVSEYEIRNPDFAKKVEQEWIDYRVNLIKNKKLEDDHEIETLVKKHYANLVSSDAFKKAIKDYYIKDMGDFVRAFYEIKQLIDVVGDLDSVNEKDLGAISGSHDIPLIDLVGASKELLEVLGEE